MLYFVVFFVYFISPMRQGRLWFSPQDVVIRSSTKCNVTGTKEDFSAVTLQRKAFAPEAVTCQKHRCQTCVCKQSHTPFERLMACTALPSSCSRGMIVRWKSGSDSPGQTSCLMSGREMLSEMRALLSFLELLSLWRQHERAPPPPAAATAVVLNSVVTAAVTYHRAQQFVNKSKPPPPPSPPPPGPWGTTGLCSLYSGILAVCHSCVVHL